MNKPALTVHEWQDQLSRLRECSDQVEAEHNAQILLAEILLRIRSSDNSIKGFIEVYSEMASKKQAYDKRWFPSSDEKTAADTAVGRFKERQQILNNEHLLPLSTSLSSFEGAFATTSICDTSNGILIIETIKEFTKLIQDLRDYTEKHSDRIVDEHIKEVEMLKGRMTSLKEDLENIEFKAHEQQEEAHKQAEEETRRKAEEAIRQAKSSYSLRGSEIPFNSIETFPLPEETSSNPTNSSTSSSNINSNGIYSMKTKDLIDAEFEMSSSQ
ncbi:hypothetical protein WR25_24594 [Diploscapter pachys]|uniref:Uncharacterized protein n=1 Tax=Diploscapter pachys TaxID=2018661 RepID=A0A2A2JBP0_9BILA|nr:hypothetical protein WR25_24594 [Diploscapter pachys]